MKRWIIVALLMLVPTTSYASDEIKDYVEFQTVKNVTYPEAVEQYNKTKKPVIVWVKSDGDDAFEAWKRTRDLGIHVFVKDFAHINAGVVVGGERDNKFVVLTTLKPGTVEEIVTGIQNGTKPPKLKTLIPQLDFSSCPDGKCPNATRR